VDVNSFASGSSSTLAFAVAYEEKQVHRLWMIYAWLQSSSARDARVVGDHLPRRDQRHCDERGNHANRPPASKVLAQKNAGEDNG
jgi:hypothetical protein